jgi:tellurite resistance protein TerC
MAFDLSALDPSTWLLVGFGIFVIGALALDLGVFHRDAHIVSTREALRWTAVWVSSAIIFGLLVLGIFGPDRAIEYFTGYVIEYSLSVDNVFVFGLVFAAFAIPREYQHRVLFWGVVGALVMRGVLILIGAELIERFDWILLVFGAFLILTAIQMLRRRGEHNTHPEQSAIVRFARRHLRVTSELHGQSFFVRDAVGRVATPLFLCLIVIEASDLVFAVDSIPAIFGVTTDPFVVFTSNAFAILGLRSLYFLLADAAARFRYLSIGLAVVLLFIGAKLLLTPWLHLPALVSLFVVIGIVGASVVASLLKGPDDDRPEKPDDRPEKPSARDLRVTG